MNFKALHKYRKQVCFAGIAVYLFTFLLPVQAQTLLRFKPQISVNARQLGDLLLIGGDKTNLATLALDSQPEVGEYINKRQILAWIKHKRGDIPYQWQGKNSAKVTAIKQTSGRALIDIAEQKLNTQLKMQGYQHIIIIPKSIVKDSEFPVSAYTVQVPIQYPVDKRVCVRLHHEKQSIAVWFDVEAYKTVLIAEQRMDKNTPVKPPAFSLQNRDITGYKESPLESIPQGMWLQHAVNKHQIITIKDTATIPPIVKGQTVQVKVKVQGLLISTQAIAEEDGSIGQIIRLKNINTQKSFSAIATAPTQAEVQS